MLKKMELRKTLIDLVGAFECTIENNIIFCSGMSMELNPPADTADIFMFQVWDRETGTFSESVLVVFIQNGDKIEFRYKKEVFEVVSITWDVITVSQNGVNYTITRLLKLPF